ncbi:hypothetical protein [Streptomyces sp. AB3(2024)]|uniref:hypothetical protein n=1 Tax=Streptomyces sp. AB3(2024) TaxID=3317321 RepID=UPI0035A3C025
MPKAALGTREDGKVRQGHAARRMTEPARPAGAAGPLGPGERARQLAEALLRVEEAETGWILPFPEFRLPAARTAAGGRASPRDRDGRR